MPDSLSSMFIMMQGISVRPAIRAARRLLLLCRSMAGDQTQDEAKDVSDNYFASTQVSRQRARDEAIEVLQGVVDNERSDDATKAQALADISRIAKDMEAEANIETLIMSKGFEQCVAVINGDAASIVVKSDGLIASQISQINEIVYEQAGISPMKITIIQK